MCSAFRFDRRKTPNLWQALMKINPVEMACIFAPAFSGSIFGDLHPMSYHDHTCTSAVLEKFSMLVSLGVISSIGSPPTILHSTFGCRCTGSRSSGQGMYPARGRVEVIREAVQLQ